MAAPGVVSTILGSPRYCGVDGDQLDMGDMTDEVTTDGVAAAATEVRRGEDTMDSGGACS